jgi:hypothetical protein
MLAVNREIDRMVGQFLILCPALLSAPASAEPIAQDTASAKSPL